MSTKAIAWAIVALIFSASIAMLIAAQLGFLLVLGSVVVAGTLWLVNKAGPALDRWLDGRG